MEGRELQKYVANCLDWIRQRGYIPQFEPGAPGWIRLSTQETFTSNQLYLLYMVEVLKKSIESDEVKP
jgi:hypothetical protein